MNKENPNNTSTNLILWNFSQYHPATIQWAYEF